jgi:hypothetical protein
MKHIVIAATVLSCFGAMSFADPGQTSLGLGVSTVGPQIQFAYRQSHTLGYRGFVAGGISDKATQTESGVTYNVDGNMGGIGMLLDYYPMNNGLRVSGGLFSSNTKIGIKSTITAPTDIGGTVYSSGTIDGNLKFARDISPLLSFGYDWNMGSNWTLGAELGAIFNDGFKAKATAGGAISQTDLDQEMKTLEDTLNKAKFYPYVSLIASYRF